MQSPMANPLVRPHLPLLLGKNGKALPWLIEHGDVINITPLPAPGAAFFARARGGRLCSYATAVNHIFNDLLSTFLWET